MYKESVTSILFVRLDLKFVMGSDDVLVKIVDFVCVEMEYMLSGYFGDVKIVEWYSYLGFVVSGGKDGALKMWDFKSGYCVMMLYGYKNVIICLKWNKNGNWLVMGLKD